MEIPGKERHSRDCQRLIKAKNTDYCQHCKLTIEDQCMRYGEFRFHVPCFKCKSCNRQLAVQEHVVFNNASHTIHCVQCSGVSKSHAIPFEYISKLTQYSFLLRVALSRLCNLLQITGKTYSQYSITVNLYYMNRRTIIVCRLFDETKNINQHTERCKQQHSTLCICRKATDSNEHYKRQHISR